MLISRMNLKVNCLIFAVSIESELIKLVSCFLIRGMVMLPVSPVKTTTKIPQIIQNGQPNHSIAIITPLKAVRTELGPIIALSINLDSV